MSSAPFLNMARSNLSPLLSMADTSFRSITHRCTLWVLYFSFHDDLNSRTHNPTNWPSRIHRFSVGDSSTVIFSTFVSDGLTPRERIARAKARRPLETMKLIDLLGDANWKESLANHTGSVLVAAIWQGRSFLPDEDCWLEK